MACASRLGGTVVPVTIDGINRVALCSGLAAPGAFAMEREMCRYGNVDSGSGSVVERERRCAVRSKMVNAPKETEWPLPPSASEAVTVAVPRKLCNEGSRLRVTLE